MNEFGRANVVVDEGENPLAWLARRALIEPHQLQAGERLRADFMRAHLMPRTTSNWSNPTPSGRRKGSGDHAVTYTDTMVASRQRAHSALDAVGPEFAGLLLDICCFFERNRRCRARTLLAARSGKIVLQLALERLARHYDYAALTRGPSHAPVRTWLAEDAAFSVDAL